MLRIDDYYQAFGDKSMSLAIDLPCSINEISYTYDGGRTALYINGVKVYENLALGSDFCITLNNNAANP